MVSLDMLRALLATYVVCVTCCLVADTIIETDTRGHRRKRVRVLRVCVCVCVCACVCVLRVLLGVFLQTRI